MLNKPSNICPKLVKLCQSGEFWPNQVTLVFIEAKTGATTSKGKNKSPPSLARRMEDERLLREL